MNIPCWHRRIPDLRIRRNTGFCHRTRSGIKKMFLTYTADSPFSAPALLTPSSRNTSFSIRGWQICDSDGRQRSALLLTIVLNSVFSERTETVIERKVNLLHYLRPVLQAVINQLLRLCGILSRLLHCLANSWRPSRQTLAFVYRAIFFAVVLPHIIAAHSFSPLFRGVRQIRPISELPVRQ